MSSGFMSDEIIINIFRNNSENQHMKVVDSYFTKTEENNILCAEGHFNIFIGRKLLMKLLMLYVHITM